MELDQGGAPAPEPPRRDKRIYFALMGTCVGLIILAWVVIWHFSVLAAVIMSVVAGVIPPFAAIIANRASDRQCLPRVHTSPRTPCSCSLPPHIRLSQDFPLDPASR
jgi:hypothetical protein